MAAAFLQFGLAAAVIVAAGTLLTRCADTIADRTGLGRLVVGSIFLGAATSLPELTVDINAVRLNLPNMAVGDLMGSCLFNLLILALADLLSRSRGGMLSRTAAAHALSGVNSIAMASLVGLFLIFERQTSSPGFAGISWGCWALPAAYVMGLRLTYYDQRASAKAAEAESSGAAGSLGLAITGYLIAAGVVLLAAPWLANAAGRIAELSGLGGTFVGTTLVAFSTSLPELVATLAAVRMNAPDLAIGNILGSNTFNLLMLLPLDLFHAGPLLPDLAPTHTLTCFAIVLVTSVVILGQLYRVERRIFFLEPDAALVIALVLAALAMVYAAE